MKYQQKARSGSNCLAALLVSASPLAAATPVTYVDATHGAAGNTAQLTWNPGTETWDSSEWTPTTNAENTGGWNNRTGFGNSGSTRMPALR